MRYFDRQSNTAPLKLSTKHLRVLDVLARLALATTEQINLALYAKSSKTTTAETLWQLFNHGYTDRIPYRAKEFGNPLVVHKITGKGAKLLRKRLLAGTLVIPSSTNYTRANEQLRHLLGINDILVDALALGRNLPTIVVEFESEPYLRRDPIVMLDKTIIVPDAWLRIRKLRTDGGVGDATMLIEYHSGQQWRKQIEEKVLAYLKMDAGEEYARRFGTNRRLVVFVVPESRPELVEEVKDFITTYLSKIHRTDALDLFAVTRYQPDFFFASGLLPDSWRDDAN